MNSLTIQPFRANGVENAREEITIYEPDDDGDVCMCVGKEQIFMDKSCARHLAIVLLKAADGCIS